MASTLDECSEFIAPEQYHAIHRFESQTHADLTQHLKRLGMIFVKHKQQSQHGIALLHRHDDLLPGCAFIYTRLSAEIIICKMEEVARLHPGVSNIVPCSFHLLPVHTFQSFEYARGLELSPLPEAFLKDIQIYLGQNHLGSIFGISRIWPGSLDGCWVETLYEDDLGLSGHLHFCKDSTQRGLTTEWRFVESFGMVTAVAMRKCEPPKEGGDHVIR